MPFLTPDGPAEMWYISCPVPDTLKPYVFGALFELGRAENWETFGALGIEETLAQVEIILSGLVEGKTPFTPGKVLYRQFVYIPGPDDISIIVGPGGYPVMVLAESEP